ALDRVPVPRGDPRMLAVGSLVCLGSAAPLGRTAAGSGREPPSLPNGTNRRDQEREAVGMLEIPPWTPARRQNLPRPPPTYKVERRAGTEFVRLSGGSCPTPVRGAGEGNNGAMSGSEDGRFHPRATPGVRWHVARTKSRQEKALQAALRTRGIPHYLPLFSEQRLHGGRRRTVEAPLFPGYVFVCTDAGGRVQVLETNRVAQILDVSVQDRL